MRITDIKQALRILAKNNPYKPMSLTFELRKLTGWKKKTCERWVNDSLELGYIKLNKKETEFIIDIEEL